MDDTLSKAEMLRSLGYAGDHEPLLRALVEAGLTNARKDRINASKLEPVRAALEARFMRVCSRGDCRARAPALAGGREIAPAADQSTCEVCAGSVAQASVDRMVEACLRRGWRRVCVVGGSPNARTTLESAVRARLELRLIDGAGSRRMEDARADIEWADVIVLWGGTQLAHKVSGQYTGPKVIQMAKRSVQEVAEEVAKSANKEKR